MNNFPHSVITVDSGVNKLTGYIYVEDYQKGLVVISHDLGYGAKDYLVQALYFLRGRCLQCVLVYTKDPCPSLGYGCDLKN